MPPLLDLIAQKLTGRLRFLSYKSPSCYFCRGLQNAREKEAFMREDYAKDWIKAAWGACYFCSWFYGMLADELGFEMDPYYSVRIVHYAGEGVLVNVTDDRGFQKMSLQVYRARSSITTTGLLKIMSPKPEIETNAGNARCIQRVGRWLQECEASHPRCRSSASSTLPRRVIDVGTEFPDIGPRLVETNGEIDRYVALSHCWGSNRTFETRSSNIRERCNGIEFLALPCTYRNAITITRELGIRYLWIDSLCILQDDIADWDVESAKMSDIYRNSFLTIAASVAPNDEHGFLTNRRGHVGKSYPLRTTRWLKRYTEIKARHIVEHHGQSESEPLHYRAWAFQERLIPRRLLSYYSTEMRWECLTCKKCECGTESWDGGYTIPSGQAEPIRRQQYHTLLADSISQLRADQLSASQRLLLYKHWNEAIIPAYSTLQLTKESDRLPALSAIASEFQSVIGDTYYAGLWQGDLLRGLTWKTVRGSEPGWLPENYRAPSWCFSSIEGHIDYLKESERKFTWSAKILSAQCTPTGSNPFGEVASGSISLYGHTTLARLSMQWRGGSWYDRGPSYVFRIGGNSKQPVANIFTECRLQEFNADVPLEARPAVENGGHVVWLGRSKTKPGQPRGDVDGNVQCLYLGTLEGNRWIKESPVFLILGRAGSEPGVFERLGILSLSLHSTDKTTNDKILDLPCSEVTII